MIDTIHKLQAIRDSGKWNDNTVYALDQAIGVLLLCVEE